MLVKSYMTTEQKLYKWYIKVTFKGLKKLLLSYIKVICNSYKPYSIYNRRNELLQIN